MLNRILCFLVFSFCLIQAFSQTPVGTIRGRIIDQDTRQPLAGARIMVISTDPIKGAISDEDGSFDIREIPIGRHSVRITYIGYDDFTASQLNLTAGKEIVLQVEMMESFVQAETVVITGEGDKAEPINQMATVSARKFSVEETQRYAAALNDPGRMASSFAGVVASGDGRNDIIIRGNSPSGLLWRLEGVDIPNPNHFANPGGSGGGISIISNYLLDNSDFFTGAFPAQYGNALSGVFDLNLRKGNNERHEFSIRPGVLGINASAEGPLKRESGASYLVNYRYSTLGLMNLFGLPIVQGSSFDYQDLSFHVNVPTRKAGRFGLFGVGGMSSQFTPIESDTANWQFRSDRTESKFGSDMGVVGLSHVYLLKDQKTYIRSVVSVSANRNYDRADTLNTDFDRTRIEQRQFVQARATASFMLNHKLSARNVFRVGFYYNRLFYSLKSDLFNFQDEELETFINNAGSTWLVQPYFQWRWRVAEPLTMTFGIHAMHLGLNGRWSFEPRAGMRWQATDKVALTAGYGMHSQILPLGTYFAETTLENGQSILYNQNLDFTKAHHAIVGYEHNLIPDLRLKVEAYYQHLFDVPIGTPNQPNLSVLNTNWGFETDSLVNGGLGRNFGGEVTLEKFFSRNYYFLFTASVYDSKYQGQEGQWRSTRYNGNYAFNFLGGKEIYFGKKRNNHFELSGRVIWLGGQRFTPIDLDASRLAQRTVYVDSLAFTERQKDYFRTDIRIAWHHNKKYVTHVLSLDFQNLFNTKNAFVQFYDAEKDEIAEFYQAGLVPIFAYQLDFSIDPKRPRSGRRKRE